MLQGRFIRLEPLDAARHGDDLWQELQGPDPALWDYLPYGPFTERAAFDAWLAGHAASRDPQFYAVVEQAGNRALGLLAYLRITPKDGCIELGHVAFGGAMQRTPGASEAVFLLARHAFDEPRLPPPRVEAQREQRPLPARRRTLRLQLRGTVPPAHDRQGREPRHRLVCTARRGVAAVS